MITLRDVMLVPHKETVRFEALRTKKFSGVSTDSRILESGNIFFALRGERFDGHTFIDAAIQRRASCIVVDINWYKEANRPQYPVPLLVVENTVSALGQLANIYRRKFRIPVIVIAGSNGKTTVKDMVAALLSTRYSVLKTEGNFNNQIGVPMTLLRLAKKNRVAVIELGTNHPGELETLVKISEPTHALVTSIGREHLEYFSTLEGVAAEEGTVFRHCRFGFVNADEPLIGARARTLRYRIRYGFKRSHSDIRGRVISLDMHGCARLHIQAKQFSKPIDIALNIPGSHNAANALAAAAVGIQFGIGKKSISRALEHFTTASKRMERLTIGNVTIINDTYNANPDSVIAALTTLASMSVSGKKIVVLGDMLELGEKSEHEHAKIGLEIADRGFEYLFTFGPKARFIFEASKLGFAQHFDDKMALIKNLCATISPGDAVLIKGSRGMKMEEVTEDVISFLKKQ